MTINWKDIDLFIFTNLDMLMIPFSDSVLFGKCTETKQQKNQVRENERRNF